MRPPRTVEAEHVRGWVDASLAACLERVNRRDLIRQLLATILVGVIATIALQIAVRSYVIEGDSMLPGLHSGDRVLVNQLAYRWGAPSRGDLVVFRFPQPWLHRDLIKRVIGLPGDVVTIRPGRVQVDDRILHEPYVRTIERYVYGPIRVPDGQYFVLGDNREISYDSHQWGFLPAGDIYGRVMLTYWPVGALRFTGP